MRNVLSGGGEGVGGCGGHIGNWDVWVKGTGSSVDVLAYGGGGLWWE
jgi:hypothetical protein